MNVSSDRESTMPSTGVDTSTSDRVLHCIYMVDATACPSSTILPYHNGYNASDSYWCDWSRYVSPPHATRPIVSPRLTQRIHTPSGPRDLSRRAQRSLHPARHSPHPACGPRLGRAPRERDREDGHNHPYRLQDIFAGAREAPRGA